MYSVQLQRCSISGNKGGFHKQVKFTSFSLDLFVLSRALYLCFMRSAPEKSINELNYAQKDEFLWDGKNPKLNIQQS